MGFKIIITAGPTNERIDSVMQITNMSTGSLGAAAATALLTDPVLGSQIDKLWYLSPELAKKPSIDSDALELIRVTDAENLKTKMECLLKTNHVDLVVHSAAVGDYKARYSTTAEALADEITNSLAGVWENCEKKDVILKVLRNPVCAADDSGKMSSYEPDLMTMMDLTPKVIDTIKKTSPDTRLIGFKLLDGVSQAELVKVASALREKTEADIIIANDLSKIRNGNHIGIFISKDGILTTQVGKHGIAKHITRLAREWFIETKTVPDTTPGNDQDNMRYIVFASIDKPSNWGSWHSGASDTVYHSAPFISESDVDAFINCVKAKYPDNNFIDGSSAHEWFLKFTTVRVDMSDNENMESLYRMTRAYEQLDMPANPGSNNKEVQL